MKKTQSPPVFNAAGFDCPACLAYAQQIWSPLILNGLGIIDYWAVARCAKCKALSIWKDSAMVYPIASIAPLANSDLPPDPLRDFDEARAIFSTSPRGSAALLRLAIQKLCVHLGQPGSNLNDDIGALVAKGLSPTVQKALDTVRVIGNESVHPGQIDLRDNLEIAAALFALVNLIVEKTISEPREIDAIYAKLPEAKRSQVARRDGG